MKARISLALCSVLFTLVLTDLCLRLIVPSSVHDQMYAPDPDLGVVLRAGSDFDFEGVAVRIPSTHVTISSQGLRDTEIAVPKPPGVRRLLCVGDSTTFGWGVEADECFCSLLDDLLGPGWETANLGIPGYNTAQEVRRLETAGLALEPDLVVLLVQDNDYQPPIAYGAGGLAGWLVHHSALVRWIRIRMKSSAAPVRPAAGARAKVLESFTALAALGAAHDFASVVFLPSEQAHAELAAHLDSIAVPWSSAASALEGANLTIPHDGHPNADGHKRLAALMVRVLKEKGLVPGEGRVVDETL